MKLATYKDSSRDGQLVVVSRDLSTAHYATGIAAKLQQALDDSDVEARAAVGRVLPRIVETYVMNIAPAGAANRATRLA